MKKKYSILSNTVYFARYAYRQYPMLSVYHIASVFCGIFNPFLGILLPGVVLNAVETGKLNQGLLLIGGMGGILLLFHMLAGYMNGRIYFLENQLRQFILADMVLKGLRCRYEYVEYGEHRETARRAYRTFNQGDSCISYRFLDYPRELLVNTACFFLYSSVIGLLNVWILAGLIGMSLLNYGILQIRIRGEQALRAEFAQSDREINYISITFQNTELAKDNRVFAMNDWLMSFRRLVFAARMRLEKRQNRKIILSEFLQFLLGVIRDGIAYAYLICAVLDGSISAGSFVIYFGAIAGFSGFLTSIVDIYANLKCAGYDAASFRVYMDLPEIEESGEEPEELFLQPAAIEFRDVSFSYGDSKIFEHFNLVIHPGEKVALLGVNGAGKTTLVKLLCGLYEPAAGQIFINGADIRTVSKKTLYRLFSVVFQEKALLPYPIGCNISLKRLEETDRERAWQAVREAGLETVFHKNGITLDTFYQGTAYEDAVELSGGEQQRLLLARAIYKDANILILDEPTSALDPIAESEIYNEYAKISRGRTSLFISHRLATTRFSDRILFLEHGQITESGTHDELMALGGSYAHMFEVQSHYYREEAGKGEKDGE